MFELKFSIYLQKFKKEANWVCWKQIEMNFSTGQAGLIIDNFIAIDRFDTNPGVKYCFLSSAHSRHYRKLTVSSNKIL